MREHLFKIYYIIFQHERLFQNSAIVISLYWFLAELVVNMPNCVHGVLMFNAVLTIYIFLLLILHQVLLVFIAYLLHYMYS